MKALKYFRKFMESEDADTFSIWLFGAIITVILIVLLIMIPHFSDSMDSVVSKLPLKLNFTPP